LALGHRGLGPSSELLARLDTNGAGGNHVGWRNCSRDAPWSTPRRCARAPCPVSTTSSARGRPERGTISPSACQIALKTRFPSQTKRSAVPIFFSGNPGAGQARLWFAVVVRRFFRSRFGRSIIGPSTRTKEKEMSRSGCGDGAFGPGPGWMEIIFNRSKARSCVCVIDGGRQAGFLPGLSPNSFVSTMPRQLDRRRSLNSRRKRETRKKFRASKKGLVVW